jgi:hypothetical protein
MTEFPCNYSNAIIGIIGTLSGVILGALINQISRSGSLNIYSHDFHIDISKQTGYGSLESQNQIDSETISVSVNFNLDLFNSSSQQKVGREIFLVINKDRKEIKEIIHDMSTIQYTQYSSRTDQLVNFNIPPKTIKNLKLTTYIKKEYYEWINGSTFFFEFRDSKNKKKRLKLYT